MSIMAGFQIMNLLLLILILAFGIAGFVMFFKVLLKLDKALAIWLERNAGK